MFKFYLVKWLLITAKTPLAQNNFLISLVIEANFVAICL
jgi:hypothetical protein